MTISIKAGFSGMSFEVSKEHYLLAWAAHLAHVAHAHQTYDTTTGPRSYVENHLIPVASAAYSQGLHDRKLARYIQSLNKSLSVETIAALLGAIGMLHDLKEDTSVKTADQLIVSLDAFKAVDYSRLVAFASVQDDVSTFTYKDNDLFAFPHDFDVRAHTEMFADVLPYVKMVDTALTLLSKGVDMSYDQYREKLFGFSPENAEERIAWLLAMVVKAQDSLSNYQSCMVKGKYSWSLKYVENLRLVSQKLAEVMG